MIELLLSLIFVTNVQVTGYRSLSSQTDDSPFITSTGERVGPHGVAISQDLLSQNGGPIHYGDYVYIEGVGIKYVNDCLNKRIHNAVDIWCATHMEEHRIWKKFENKKMKLYLIKNKEK